MKEKQKSMKMTTRGELGEIVMDELGFSPEIINELYDTLTQTKAIITEYQSMSSRLSVSLREEIGNLMIDSDILLLNFNEVYLISAIYVEKLKKEFFTGKKSGISVREKEELLKKIENLKIKVKAVILKTEKYINEVKSHFRNQPLPIE